MSRVTSFSAVTSLMLWVACVVLGCYSDTATLKSHPVHRRTPRAAALGHAAPVTDGKVDVFLDLACPDSAAAWPTIKETVWGYGFRTEFVFHVLPTSQTQVAFDAAKAVQVMRMHSVDNDEVFLFIDSMLDHQHIILSEGDEDDDMTRLEIFDIVVSWAVAQSSVTEDQFRRGMEDARVDRLVTNELEAAALVSVYATPMVLLNGIFMMHLIEAETLQDFQLFVGVGMTPKPMVFD